MNAYLIRSSPCSGTDAKARCLGGFLPAVSCNECKTEWFADRVWYPTTRLADESKKKLYSDERTVSLEELIRLREGIVPGSKARTMPPGAGIGPIEAQLSPYATDFVWSAFLLLAAKPAIEKLEDRGVRVPHGSATVFLGPKCRVTSQHSTMYHLRGCTRCLTSLQCWDFNSVIWHTYCELNESAVVFTPRSGIMSANICA